MGKEWWGARWRLGWTGTRVSHSYELIRGFKTTVKYLTNLIKLPWSTTPSFCTIWWWRVQWSTALWSSRWSRQGSPDEHLKSFSKIFFRFTREDFAHVLMKRALQKAKKDTSSGTGRRRSNSKVAGDSIDFFDYSLFTSICNLQTRYKKTAL